MIKPASFILILFLSVPLIGADSRVERWNTHIERIKKMQEIAGEGKSDITLINRIASEELKSSQEFLKILKRQSSNDGSLKADTKKYSITEIETRVRESVVPAIALSYMADMNRTLNDSRIIDAVSKEIITVSEKRFRGMPGIAPENLFLITRIYLIEKGMSEYNASQKRALTDIISRTGYELSRTDYSSDEITLNGIIRSISEQVLVDYKFITHNYIDETLLENIPQWRELNSEYKKSEDRSMAVMNFVSAKSGNEGKTDPVSDTESAEKDIFLKAKSRISVLLANTAPPYETSGNTPLFEIPDIKKISLAVDEIDRYRVSIMKNVKGIETEEYIVRLQNNSRGIAARYLQRIDSHFRNEEQRIERLKKLKGLTIIYNEELFKTARSHFVEVRDELNRYAELSADFIGIICNSGKRTPEEYLQLRKYRNGRYLKYISFYESLSGSAAKLSEAGGPGLQTLYRSSIPGIISTTKEFLKPEGIPSHIRNTLTRNNLKEYMSDYRDFRIEGTSSINSIRNNYNLCLKSFSEGEKKQKEQSLALESRICQDETERLYAFAKKCAGTLSSMDYTARAITGYRDGYSRLKEEIETGNIPPLFNQKNPPESLFHMISGFEPEGIEKETGTREILSSEGMVALSGAVTLLQYYKRKGINIEFRPTAEEVADLKREFMKSPEITVSSWRMNGRNFRQIDANITAEIRKAVSRNAWNGGSEKPGGEKFSISGTNITVTFTPPSGWEKTFNESGEKTGKISFKSPDSKGVIEITSISVSDGDIQSLASQWPKKYGYLMVEKNWGKKDNSDYIKSRAKNRYDGIMESYIIAAEDGRIIILSGKSTGDMFRKLDSTLEEIFMNLQISG